MMKYASKMIRKLSKADRNLIFPSMFLLVCCICLMLQTSCISDSGASQQKKTKESISEDSIPSGLKKIQNAYPDFIAAAEPGFLVWKDGTKMIFDDGKRKESYEDLLNSADLEDQMKQDYPVGKKFQIPDINNDPGRIRNEAFFMKMYGSTRQEVMKNLVSVKWLSGKDRTILRVTKINGIDKKVEAISKELESKPELIGYLKNPGGGFMWRSIEGTQRKSTHSYGIAIDINTASSDYWKWAKGEKLVYKNRIPMEIVEIFEKYGFIWGGKWYHYDTMHFEYRPELIGK
jgi:peptidoglycan LD-endopeptidase CwlK